MLKRRKGGIARAAGLGLLLLSLALGGLAEADSRLSSSSLASRLYEDVETVIRDEVQTATNPQEWVREHTPALQGGDDSTMVQNTMESGRLEWATGAWSDCEVTDIPYCGTYQGIERRPVFCTLASINGSGSKPADGYCINAVGPKPPTTRSCNLKVETDCTPAPTIIRVTSSPSGSLLANNSDSATVTATMQHANGTRAAGEEVTWSTSRGRLSRATSVTNSNGQASVAVRSGSIGSARVTASSYDSSMSTLVDFVTPVPGLEGLTASPSRGVIPNNSDTSTITATVRHANGKAAAGVRVDFSTNRGSLNATYRITNSNGKASVALRSPTSGTATVTARHNGDSRQVNVVFPSPRVVGLSASPSSGVKANNSDRSTITAVVRYPDGTAASGERVNFSTSRGTLSATSRTTNINGRASVTLRSGSAGTARVTARSNGTSRYTNVSFVTPSVTKFDNGHRAVYTSSSQDIMCPGGGGATDGWRVYWGGNQIYSGASSNGGRVVRGGYTYTWETSLSRANRESHLGGTCWVNTYEFSVTRTPN